MNQHKLLPIAFSLAILTSLIGAQTNVAIIPLDAKGVSDIEASVLTDRLAFELFKTGLFTVLERGKMEEILTEQNFQLTGCVTEECLVEVGQLLGVEQMMAGSVSKIGNTYSVILRLIDAESGAIVQVAGYDHQGTIDQLLSQGMSVVARSIAGQPVEPAAPAIPLASKGAASSAQGHIYVFPRLGIGFSDMGADWSVGGQVGYGNESWGKMYFDMLFGEYIFNLLAVYESGFRPLYWQFGLGYVSDTDGYWDDNEEDPMSAGGLGFRVGLGYNYAMGKYLLIRPALELNLGLKEHSSNYAINLNFGFKTPNLW